MQTKTLIIALISASTVTLSGCSGMWNGVSTFSDYMAEKTSWIKMPSLRGPQRLQTASNETLQNLPEWSEVNQEAYTPELVEVIEEPAVPTVDENGFFTPASAISYDSEGNMIVDTSPIPCPAGTYLTEENTCNLLD